MYLRKIHFIVNNILVRYILEHTIYENKQQDDITQER